jgi:hypothetical protein
MHGEIWEGHITFLQFLDGQLLNNLGDMTTQHRMTNESRSSSAPAQGVRTKRGIFLGR